MPLEVASFDTVKTYCEETPGARIYYRQEGRNLTVVAGMLSWKGKIKDGDEFESTKAFLDEHNAIEVLSFKDVRELFA